MVGNTKIGDQGAGISALFPPPLDAKTNPFSASSNHNPLNKLNNHVLE
jgi:hypothetical protein